MKTIKANIKGMHCSSCEVVIEHTLKKVPGVQQVRVDAHAKQADVTCAEHMTLDALQDALKGKGYTLEAEEGTPTQSNNQETTSGVRRYAEIGAAAVILFGVYLLLNQLDILPKGVGLTENMSYGVVFVIGLIAATSTCLAVTGGLLLAISTKMNEHQQNLTGLQKFQPHIYFNIGRIASYTALGGLIGLVGSAITLSPTVNGVITIIASVLMVLVGLQLLNILPLLNKIKIAMPKAIAHKLYDQSEGKAPSKGASFLFGGATFFLPCGFTQALQLYVLGKGDPVVGALTMLVFSLGTLPALVSLGAVSSTVKGAAKRHFLTVSAVLIIMLGAFSLPNGLLLAGAATDFPLFSSAPSPTLNQAVLDENVQLIDGKQVVHMRVSELGYSPSYFKVLQNVPVEWVIDGTQAVGCAQVITSRTLGIQEYLPKDRPKVVMFTPTEQGVFPFSCPMGMTTRGAAFEVVPNDAGYAPRAEQQGEQDVFVVSAPPAGCDPTIMECNVQKLFMEISKERGFFPKQFTVKKNVPVELEIDTKTPMRGCMSTLVIPEYQVAHLLSLGKTVVRFTPTTEGVVPFTCSMGSKMGEFIVTL